MIHWCEIVNMPIIMYMSDVKKLEQLKRELNTLFEQLKGFDSFEESLYVYHRLRDKDSEYCELLSRMYNSR